MTIQEVAEQTGISAYTIRFYENAWMLPPIKRLPNGMRQFTEADLTIPLESPHGQLDLATAAAFPMVATTAYDTLVNVARLQAGETVLIHAAAGGVGSVAGQLARALGASRVLGTV